MALLRMHTVINPSTGTVPPSPGSVNLVYNTDNINWATLASKTGSGGAASTFFDYTLQGGGIGKAAVKASIGAIAAAAGASQVS
jgi:hypothetical protein